MPLVMRLTEHFPTGESQEIAGPTGVAAPLYGLEIHSSARDPPATTIRISIPQSGYLQGPDR